VSVVKARKVGGFSSCHSTEEACGEQENQGRRIVRNNN